jgi:periplasmic glucans biosynthesis protein
MTEQDEEGGARAAPMSRRGFAQAGISALIGSLGTGWAARVLAAPAEPGRFGPPQPFAWQGLVDRARTLAAQPYQRHLATKVVDDFDAHVRLSYDKADMLPHDMRLFPARKGIAPIAVAMHVIEHGMSREIISTRGLFGAGGDADAAGFRVLNPDGGSDWLAFLGATYFRAAGPRGQYGASARAVAIDTALPGPEEFPDFTAFWIDADAPGGILRVYALIEGPSLAGAFRIDTSRSPDAMVQDVESVLFLRHDVHRLGIAPITTMFDFDQSAQGIKGEQGDWRPEVHDSDGLAIWNGNGERIWRPLDNPRDATVVHMLHADHMKGFGMIQRDQDFNHYHDDIDFYDKRPSLWVEPRGDWGTGAVMLYEMWGKNETIDNMATMWVSDTPARAGQRRDFAYRLHWVNTDPTADGNARLINNFTGPGGVPGADPIPGVTRYVFDFAGPPLQGLPRDAPIKGVTNLPPEAVLLNNSYAVAWQDSVWRITLDVRTEGLAQSEFRLFLQRGGDAISETVLKTVRP